MPYAFRKFAFPLLPLLLPLLLHAQSAPTPAAERLRGFEQRRALAENSLLGALPATNIGPSVFSGRVTDLDVNPADPTRMYVAYASGGLWYSDNNGTTFQPVFDREASMTIGDIAVDWARGTVWVGTGEANSSRSSYAGTGMYRSTDGGKTWQPRGLPESHHIGRVVLHPTNPDILWVAVLGHLYTPNPERGVYKTTDGGSTWTRTLFVNDTTGAIDLVLDPNDANTLYAATWDRQREAWNFRGAGAGSGIYKSTDGGQTWQNISGSGSAPATAPPFPTGSTIGRIGLAAGKARDGHTVLYASVDNQTPRPKKARETAAEALTKDLLRSMSRADFLKLEEERLGAFLKSNNFPEKYTPKTIKDLVENESIAPVTLVEYLEDANASLFETDYAGAEVYRSDDGGRTWARTHNDPLEQINFTYGYYFSNVRCQPDNADKVYLLGFFIIKSDNGGKTWKNINGDNVHVDHHALWLAPARPGHLVNGNDGGVNISYDDGASWIKANDPPVAQFYAVAVDSAETYNVYGGTQDNGVWAGPSTYRASTEWHQTGRYPYQELLGGDGMYVAVDPRDNNTVYTGFQFGNYFRVDKRTGKQTLITPRHELGERPLRFNWQTPIHLSRHNPDILYLGANRLYRSFDRGAHWQPISADLTGGGRKGNVPYGTLTSIDESPKHFGLLYAGSDDGLVHVSRDGGMTWTNITPFPTRREGRGEALPAHLWVSRVQASHHERGRVYLALSGYRNDDFTPYVYRSDDYGTTWTKITAGLPPEPVNVVREDPANPDLLYVGTDHGLYVSLDRGASFQALGAGLPPALPTSREGGDTTVAALPAVAVHDLAIQTRAGELIVGTHGRSLYKINIRPLQKLTAKTLERPLVVLEAPEKKRYSATWGKRQPWQEVKNPELPVTFYVRTAGPVQWSVRTADGLALQSGTLTARRGINSFVYTLDVQPDVVKKYAAALQQKQKDPKKPLTLETADSGKIYLRPGKYVLTLSKDGQKQETEFIIE